MNLIHLSNFIQVVEWGNISKAAQFLNIAQPALSRQILSLEEELGAKLLRRHTWGVEPTEDGKNFLECARRIQKECTAARESVQLKKGSPVGTAYLGVPSAYAVTLVPPLLQRMRVIYPNIRVHVVEAFSGTIYEWLISGRLDLAVLYYSKEYNAAETTPFIDEDMVVVGAPAILKDKTRMPLSELGDRKLVVPWRPHIFRLVLEAAFISAGIPFTPNIEIDSLPCMKELAHCGDGFTILPPSSVFQEVESGRLACVPTSPEIKLTTVLGQTPGRQPSRAASIVDAELRKLAAELAPRTGWSMTV